MSKRGSRIGAEQEILDLHHSSYTDPAPNNLDDNCCLSMIYFLAPYEWKTLKISIMCYKYSKSQFFLKSNTMRGKIGHFRTFS